jgi:hypothetical protein
MDDFVLRLPPDFDDYGWEVESKGWFDGADVVWEDRIIRISFYDPARLAEDVAEQLSGPGVVAFRNLVVVPVVTREAMTEAVRRLVDTGEIGGLSQR